jgi:hypothetical protein
MVRTKVDNGDDCSDEDECEKGIGAVVLTSHEYGATWNTVQGLDAVRYFTSQGGTNPGGPLESKHMSVR